MVFWTKEISLPHFNRYRVKFRRVWSGKVEEMDGFLIKHKKRKTLFLEGRLVKE